MSQLPQTPLDYDSPGDPGPPLGHPFFVGLVIGSLISAVAWSLWWHSVAMDPVRGGDVAVIVLVPALKIVASAICLWLPRWRRFGAGLLTSIAIGFMIFFGLCASNIIQHA